ncbi:hypothetical protein [Aquimonas voraii]|uniref:Uncharacterized protein n=1 Tax=Aquimonas voraii TaxID=265719 RepID=A0A1G6TVA3_9GAMM|nr:hypothetical protein [Aquimonas voraii]SDD32979.1 hypothetical protein SAMN04488509_10221 [Aquimonas voraii]
MSHRADSPVPGNTAIDPRIGAEWRRQEAARGSAVAGEVSGATQDPLYRALARAAALPAPALPVGFAARLQQRVQRGDAGDRFEIALLGGVLTLGGLLALFYGLPVLAELLQPLQWRLPAASDIGLHWALMGAATLALSGLVSGLIERRRGGPA